MQIQRIDNQHPTPNATVTVKKCGNVTEVRYSVHGSPEIGIKKLNKDEYLDLRTGAIEPFKHHANRAGDKASVAGTFCKLRGLIRCNSTDPETVLFVTLTYKTNIRDDQKLYEDFHAFIKRFRRYLKREDHPPVEYIAVAEPQGRGAWHLHVLLLFPEKAPFIPNAHMAKLWGHGFTKTQSLKGVTDPGLYLTAYLGNMELSEAVKAGQFKAGRLAETKDKSKAVIKGSRLMLYPPGFNCYRCSRGVKRPKVCQMTEEEAQAEVSGMPLTYEKTISISDESGTVRNIINYRTYTKAPAENDNKTPTKTEPET